MGLREYGLGNYTEYVIGRPRVVRMLSNNELMDGHKPECPNCGVLKLAEVEVVLQNMPLIKARYAVGRYLSCPACPWASPMLCVGVERIPEWWRDR